MTNYDEKYPHLVEFVLSSGYHSFTEQYVHNVIAHLEKYDIRSDAERERAIIACLLRDADDQLLQRAEFLAQMTPEIVTLICAALNPNDPASVECFKNNVDMNMAYVVSGILNVKNIDSSTYTQEQAKKQLDYISAAEKDPDAMAALYITKKAAPELGALRAQTLDKLKSALEAIAKADLVLPPSYDYIETLPHLSKLVNAMGEHQLTPEILNAYIGISNKYDHRALHLREVALLFAVKPMMDPQIFTDKFFLKSLPKQFLDILDLDQQPDSPEKFALLEEDTNAIIAKAMQAMVGVTRLIENFDHVTSEDQLATYTKMKQPSYQQATQKLIETLQTFAPEFAEDLGDAKHQLFMQLAAGVENAPRQRRVVIGFPLSPTAH